MERYTSVDDYINAQSAERKDLLEKIRSILNSTALEETVKWGAPAYTYEGKTLVGMGSFKDFVAIWFHQGALLTDSHNKLINAQEGVTKALRQWRLSSEEEIDEGLIKKYVEETLENHRQGKEIKPQKAKELLIPPELSKALEIHKEARIIFEGMSRSKQREYAEHIAEAKREETKKSRIEKILPMILSGKGLYDKYKK